MEFPESEQQYLCSELVTVHQEGAEAPVVANLEEIRFSGATLLTETPIASGIAVDVVCQGGTLSGSVHDCNRNELGYFVTVVFDEDCHWSPELFRPAHMLDPLELIRRKAESRKAG